eukprot:augustus_masked-scaffold_7-processed-gene-15.58-mRNA-1 protein AED:0.31 eAED:0.31 QI:0/-1/0/1/-1/1/1/0/939
MASQDPFAKVKDEKSNAVVSIEMTYPRAFGIEQANAGSATGFIVDKERGIILTNKHVVKEGPVRAKARFLKHEEIDLVPIFRDPVHDFGFFKFNTADLVETPLVEIELDPEGVVKGKKTLVIGNNGGERLSFVETTVSRVDRPAPNLLDLNTFYVTASDTGVGGSSGAPMLGLDGKAIAMVAAGNDSTNISMYLPLHQVARSLEYVQRGEKPPRGTLQVGFSHKTFESLLKRNTISDSTVEVVKKEDSEAFGMLVVEKNLPKGPGRIAGIKNGDVLLKLNGKIVHNYVNLEQQMDTYVGKSVTVEVIREGKAVSLNATIQNLAEISNTRMVEVSNGIFHNIQYLVAMYLNLPIEGVFTVKSGYMFGRVPFGSIIKSIGNVKVETLDDFVGAIKVLPNAKLVSVQYQPLRDQNKVEIVTAVVDKRWYPFQLATRDDVNGRWDYQTIPEVLKQKSIARENTESRTARQDSGEDSELSEDIKKHWKAAGALIKITASSPFSLDGEYPINNYTCMGVILDKKLGIVACPNDVVHSTLVDIIITFSDSKTIPGSVVLVHPILPFAFVRYDPSYLADDHTVQVSDIPLSKKDPVIGEKLSFVGVSAHAELVTGEAKVQKFSDENSGNGELYGHTMAKAPLQTMGLSKDFGGGLYLSEDGELKALNLYTNIVAPSQISGIFETIRAAFAGSGGEIPKTVKQLPITISFLSLAEARNIRGLSDDWASKLQKTMSIYQRKLIVIKRRKVDSDCYERLKENDILLTIDGNAVSLVKDFYDLTLNKDSVKIRVLRDSKEVEVSVSTAHFSTVGTTRLIQFGGLSLQDPHEALYYVSKPEIINEGGVYITYKEEGSPAQTSEMQAQDFSNTSALDRKLVFKVDDTVVTDLESFLTAVKKKKHDEYVRIYAKDLMHGEESVHDIRLDLEYWKTKDMILGEDGEWQTKYVVHG